MPFLQAQSIFEHNLIVNGGAEASRGDNGSTPPSNVPGWTLSGAPRVVTYASTYVLRPSDIGPANRGQNYFLGGPNNAVSTLSQTIDFSSGASAIDSGNVSYDISAYLGGGDGDNAALKIDFLGSSHNQLATVALGPVLPADKASSNGIYLRRQIGLVPAGTRSASVTLQLNRSGGSQNFAAADSLKLVLNNPGAAGTVLNTNLISNPGAESAAAGVSGTAVDVPNWVRTAYFSTDSYTDSDGDLSATSPGPSDRGSNYFWGGTNQVSSAYQDIDISAAGSLIDSGKVTYALSAWLGGYSSQGDNTVLTADFKKWDGTTLATSTLGPVTPQDRNNISALQLKSQNGTVPSGARLVRITMTMNRTDGSDNDGLADSLSLVLSSAGVTGLPWISADSVLSAAAFGGFNSIAPGSWIEIYGSNLSSTTGEWGGGDFQNGKAPTTLNGVNVTIGGQQAFVRYTSPGQVNVQVPDITAGQKELVLSSPNGTSETYTVNVNSTQPGLLAPGSFSVEGRQYVVAQLPDNTFILPPDTIHGLTTRAVHPGETIVIYGIGFGAVSPSNPAGQIETGSNQLAGQLQVQIGGANAQVTYQGLAPNFVGLYQFNVVVPNIADNDFAPVTFSLGGVPVAQDLYLAVSK